jgi:hypothetical protein
MRSRDKLQELCVECKRNYAAKANQEVKPAEVIKIVPAAPVQEKEALKALEDEK